MGGKAARFCRERRPALQQRQPRCFFRVQVVYELHALPSRAADIGGRWHADQSRLEGGSIAQSLLVPLPR
jgi:hypothetical protein